MLALLGVWVALLSLLVSLTMLVFRPAFTDLSVTLVLYFGAPGALCLGGVVLWSYRKEPDNEPGIHAQRVQAAAAIGLAIAAAAIVYGLIIGSQKIERIDGQAPASYNSPPGKPNPGESEGIPLKVVVNGQTESFADDLSVAELLNLQKLDPIRVAVEVNEDIVRRKDYAVARLNDGDRVEIVTFVGGG